MQIVRSFGLLAQAIMLKDADLLEQVEHDQLILHLFTWPQKSLSMGCFFDPVTLLNLPWLKEQKWNLATRPTGGGVMIHQGDYCFSLIAGPNHFLRKLPVLESYWLINSKLILALTDCFYQLKDRLTMMPAAFYSPAQARSSCCLLHPTQYDIAIDQKKIVGSAQRRKKGLLHQCSLRLESIDTTQIKNLFLQQTYATMITSCSSALDLFIQIDRLTLEHALVKRLGELGSPSNHNIGF